MLLEETCEFHNQMLHYCNEFNNFVVGHHKLSFSCYYVLISF